MNACTTSPRSTALEQHLSAEKSAFAKIIQSEHEAGVPYFDRTVAVSDPVITPFLNAMKADGWIPKLARSGCLAETQPCKHCQKPASRYAFIRDDAEIRCCVYCDH